MRTSFSTVYQPLLCGLLSLSILTTASAATSSQVADAAKRRDKSAVRALLETARAEVNTPQADGATALQWASHWGDLETVELLLGAGADANKANDYGVTPLALAAENRDLAIVKALLKAGANPNAARVTGETVLMTAAWTGNVEIVEALIKAGALVDAKEKTMNHTALIAAVHQRHSDVVRMLVDHDADVRVRASDTFTPLHYAARMGDVESARALIVAGAKVDEPAGANGPTALIVATVRGHVPMAIFLLERGADPNYAGTGYTAMHWAAGNWETTLTGKGGITPPSSDDPRFAEWSSLAGLRTGRLELIQALLKHGANPNARLEKLPPRLGFGKSKFEGRNLTGATPFLLAAHAGDAAAMRILADGGADPTLPTPPVTDESVLNVLTYDESTGGGLTPLMAAAGLGRVMTETLVTPEMAFEAAKLALELGNDVNAKNDYGETALHAAAHIRHNELIKYLVARGADVHVRTTHAFGLNYGPVGQSPEDYAEFHVVQGGLPVHEKTSTGDLLRELAAAADDKQFE